MSELRDKIRSAIFSGENKPLREPLKFFGTDIELCQPSVSSIFDAQQAMGDDRKAAIVNMMIAYAVVPGTDEHVFEETDAASILVLPWGPDFNGLMKAITKLTDVDLATKEATKN